MAVCAQMLCACGTKFIQEAEQHLRQEGGGGSPACWCGQQKVASDSSSGVVRQAVCMVNRWQVTAAIGEFFHLQLREKEYHLLVCWFCAAGWIYGQQKMASDSSSGVVRQAVCMVNRRWQVTAAVCRAFSYLQFSCRFSMWGWYGCIYNNGA
jgi:hypothetical protein